MTAALLAAIRAVPDDSGARAVYSDWLIEQGDPRGEWIALHRSASEEAELKRRALWQVHKAKWRTEDVGTNELDTLSEASYRGGFLDEVRLDQAKLVELAPTLARQPIRSLRVHAIEDLAPLTKLPLLETVDTVDLGYGLERSNTTALLALLTAMPRLRRLSFTPQVDVPFIWEVLERLPQRGELISLSLASINVPVDRAKWLGRELPVLRELRFDCALADPSLLALAEHAAFELSSFGISDHDGLYGRARRMTDGAIATVLGSPFVRGLESLSLSGCAAADQTAQALAAIPCADKLVSLDLGSQVRSQVVRGLEACTFPNLGWLSIRHNNVSDRDLDAIRQFSSLTTLRVEKNAVGRDGVETILAHLPKLESLFIGDNPLGDSGVLAIAWSEKLTALRHLEIGSTDISGDAVEGILDSGKLTELRSLNLACNEAMGRPAIKKLADGPFEKLALLSLSYASRGDISPLFAQGWLPADENGEDKYQRRLEPSGHAVPCVTRSRKPKKVVEAGDARAIDETSAYQKGEHVKHAEHGVGIVSAVTTLYLDVKFSRVGALRFSRTPPGAVPFDMTHRFAPGQVITHPTFGAGMVLKATSDRIEVEFGVAGKKTMMHGRA